MPDKRVVLQIDRPHFEVKLHSDTLEVNLKEGVRKEIEKLAEGSPHLAGDSGLGPSNNYPSKCQALGDRVR